LITEAIVSEIRAEAARASRPFDVPCAGSALLAKAATRIPGFFIAAAIYMISEKATDAILATQVLKGLGPVRRF
jgi:hypothetical protein